MTTQTPQERTFIHLLNEANINFTPHFFGNFGKSLEAILETKSRLSELLDTASELKEKYLKKIQPEGQLDKLKTKEQIDAAYAKLHENIEEKNEFLKNKDEKTKRDIEALQKEIDQNNFNKELLEDKLLEAEQKLRDGASSTKVTSSPGAMVDRSDPGVILRTNNDIVKMKTLVPDTTKK